MKLIEYAGKDQYTPYYTNIKIRRSDFITIWILMSWEMIHRCHL
jgi:hypothetical protein